MKAKKKGAHARLASFLQGFVDFLKNTKDVFSKSQDFKIENFNNLKLLVGASKLSNADGKKQACGLLINPSNSTCQKMKQLLRKDAQYLFEQLINRTTILKGTSYLSNDAEDLQGEI
jgi:hypothetical protein